MALFNSHIYSLHHKRALKSFHDHAFLFDHVGAELMGRVEDVKKNFAKVLDLSPHSLGCHPHFSTCHPRPLMCHPRLRGDDNWVSEGASFDLILSCLHAHWVNDLPGFLVNIRHCLQPGGLFLGALWGGNTLFELRESLLQAELSLKGGASPRIAPMLQPTDAPLLMGRAGFKDPVVDTEILTVTYDSLWSLMKDLRGMGETNKLQDRVKTFTSRSLFEKAEEIYQNSFALSNAKLSATFEVIYLTGWGNSD